MPDAMDTLPVVALSAPAVQPEAVDPDEACAAAIDLARRAITDSLDDVAVGPGVAAEQVGEHLGVTAEVPRSAVHRFAALLPGYVGWTWVVLLVRADGEPQVADVVLLPGQGALLAPAWTPWDERIRPGDLGAGDLLPTTPDDPRLVPGYTGEGDADADAVTDPDAVLEVAWELGLGRERVLSPWGRDEAFMRWLDGDTGPETPMARQAPGPCMTCGFLMPVRGHAGPVFGVCANEYSPADGRIVSLAFGCGAHSDAPAQDRSPVDVVDIVVDDYTYLPLESRVRDVRDASVDVSGDEAVDEVLDGSIDEAVDVSVDESADASVDAAATSGTSTDDGHGDEAQQDAGDGDVDGRLDAQALESVLGDDADDEGDQP